VRVTRPWGQILSALAFTASLSLASEPSALTTHFPAASQTYAERQDHWTPAQARANCTALAFLAVRRATIVRLVFTRPARHLARVWTLTGVAHLSGAPDGLRQAPFICTCTAAEDAFRITPAQLTMGP